MSARTKKSGQRKAFAVGIAAFASVCLIATGFAAWVISAKAEEKKTGNVNIGTVAESNVKINNASFGEGKDKLSFNPEANDTTGRVRYDGTNAESRSLRIRGDVGPERFVTSFKIRLDIAKEQAKEGSEATEWVADEDANQRFVEAQNKNYITLPNCFGQEVDIIDQGAYKKSSSITNESHASFDYTRDFEWGSVFGGINPGRYYDEDAVGKNKSDAEVSSTLNDFSNILRGTTASTTPSEGTTLTDGNLTFLVTLTAGTDQK